MGGFELALVHDTNNGLETILERFSGASSWTEAPEFTEDIPLIDLGEAVKTPIDGCTFYRPILMKIVFTTCSCGIFI